MTVLPREIQPGDVLDGAVVEHVVKVPRKRSNGRTRPASYRVHRHGRPPLTIADLTTPVEVDRAPDAPPVASTRLHARG